MQEFYNFTTNSHLPAWKTGIYYMYIIFDSKSPFNNMEEYILLCLIYLITNHQLLVDKKFRQSLIPC